MFRIKVIGSQKGSSAVIMAKAGESLREVLLKNGFSPYRGRFRALNCKGLGICGSCSVKIKESGTYWLRRSCQITCFQNMEIELDK